MFLNEKNFTACILYIIVKYSMECNAHLTKVVCLRINGKEDNKQAGRTEKMTI